jgi:hypothetical protein
MRQFFRRDARVLHGSIALAAFAFCSVLGACSSPSNADRRSRSSAQEGDAGANEMGKPDEHQGQRASGTSDAAPDAPAVCTRPGDYPVHVDASGFCPDGWWQNTSTACGPFGGPCQDVGDDLCYRLCATADDCPDPCAPACRGMSVFGGGDTPSGYTPVCQAGVVSTHPPECDSKLRACWGSCKAAGARQLGLRDQLLEAGTRLLGHGLRCEQWSFLGSNVRVRSLRSDEHGRHVRDHRRLGVARF